MDIVKWLRNQWDRAAAIAAVGFGVVALILGYLGVSRPDPQGHPLAPGLRDQRQRTDCRVEAAGPPDADRSRWMSWIPRS